MTRPIQRILVAIKDPEGQSLPAVAKATQLAAALGAEIELYHAIDTPLYVDQIGLSGQEPVDIEQRWRERYLGQLELIGDRVRRHGVKVTTAVEWDFPVYEAIVRRASRISADLIVVERHAHRHVAPWLLHFTDWELLRLAPVPVLLVKTPKPYHRPVVLSAVDPSRSYSKPGELDREILDAGQSLSGALKGKFHALHAYLPLPPDMIMGFDAAIIATSDIGARMEAKAAANAKSGFERILRGVEMPRTRQHLVAGHPMDVIPDTVRETGANIVVMGAISRTGLKRVFIGNTAERVLDQLPCDVLVVKPPRFVSQVRRARRGPRLAVTPMPI